MNFSNKTVLITGASRGIGRAIALKLGQAGANIIIASKTDTPHKVLPGTIHSVKEEIEKAGGVALAFVLDVRNEDNINEVIDNIVAKFGGIDMCINNASAISLTSTQETPMKRYDLMQSVNARGTFAVSRACIPHLEKSKHAHILNLSPPLNMDSKWFKDHVAYTMSKYGMSMCTLGMSEELKDKGICVNSLWPKTTIATSAIKVHFPKEIYEASRTPQIMADAAFEILSTRQSGQFFIDEKVLSANGVTDFSHYAVNPKVPTYPDLFL